MGEVRNLIHVHLLHPIRKEKGHEKSWFSTVLVLERRDRSLFFEGSGWVGCRGI